MTAAQTNRGKETERMVVRWLRANGFPHCERQVRTGHRTKTRTFADQGDLDLCPGVVASVKALSPVNRAERAIRDWMHDAEQQRQAKGAALCPVILRRVGTSDVGQWWCWLMLHTLDCLRNDTDLLGDVGAWTTKTDVTPVRLELGSAAHIIREAGYGTPVGDRVEAEATG
ncbi:MAG: hypothetical protein ACRDQA_07530 [Nocardioidaceae bacterium]